MTPKKQSQACPFQTEKDGESLTLSFRGRLDVSNAPATITSLTSLLHDTFFNILTVDLKELTYLDDYGIVVLARLKKMAADNRVRFTLVNAGEKIQEILAFHHFDDIGRPHPLAPQKKKLPDPFTPLGQAVLTNVSGMTYTLTFLGTTFFSLLRIIRSPTSLRWKDTLYYMRKTGVDALPIVGMISLLLGLIMAFMSSVQLQQFGANIYVASLVGLSMTRELGPIMTCIIVAGRSSSAFAAEIGSMKISEEIDALFTMGFDPHLFLVIPKIVASFLVVPMLTLFSDVFAITGGMIVGIGMLDLTMSGYINQTINTLSLFDVFWGVLKSAVFALLISWTGCLRGFQVRGGAMAVGQATTSAVVSSIFLIILADSVLAVILRYWE